MAIGASTCSTANGATRGLPPINHKRVLRIVQTNGLVLTPHTVYRPARTDDGVVIACAPTSRWCSDHLELKCRNGDIVHVLFVIDACDCEIIAWSDVAQRGVSGQRVRDLMMEAGDTLLFLLRFIRLWIAGH